MAKNKKQFTGRDPLPEEFHSLEDFWAFWDTHSTADYEGLMEDVDVHIDIGFSKAYYALARDLIAQLRPYARQQGISTETLINIWLREKVLEKAQRK